jgi:RHS repeat-associated protein
MALSTRTWRSGGSSPAAKANLLTGLGIDEYFTRTDSSGTMAFLSDALGSTVGLVNSAGGVGTSYAYQPFGATTVSGTNGNPYQFTGRENDGTGLYFYRARYYSPTFQRFIAQDPIGFRGGDANLYAYVFNDPVNLLDPLGLWTAFLGGSFSYTSNGNSVSLSIGLVIDGEGHLRVALTTGVGSLSYGQDFSAGGLFQVSNAESVCDLQGPFADFTAGGEGLSGEYFAGQSPHGFVQGLGVGFGEGIGVGGGYSVTSTTILPIF